MENGVNITNSSNPLFLTKNITLTVIDCCIPPPLRLAASYIRAGTVIAASIAGPNPVTLGSAIYLITELHEQYY